MSRSLPKRNHILPLYIILITATARIYVIIADRIMAQTEIMASDVTETVLMETETETGTTASDVTETALMETGTTALDATETALMETGTTASDATETALMETGTTASDVTETVLMETGTTASGVMETVLPETEMALTRMAALIKTAEEMTEAITEDRAETVTSEVVTGIISQRMQMLRAEWATQERSVRLRSREAVSVRTA